MFSEATLSRRRFLTGALVGMAAAGLVVAGCGGGEKQPETPEAVGTSEGQPKRGGTLRVATTATIVSLDPHTTAGVSVAPYLYSYVVHATDWQGTVGDLAESWEVVDELDWIFKIRGDVRFQDIPPVGGRPLVAEDVRLSIDRAKSLPGASESWGQWVESYATPDAKTFTLRTKTPYGYLLMLVGSTMSAIVPMEAVEEFGDLRTNAIGSGPFMVKLYSRDQGLEMVRNPNYYHEFPYIDGISVRVIPDESSIQAAFRAGSIDVYGADNRLKADAVRNAGGTSIRRYLDRAYAVIRLNGSKFEAFKDERVREAIDLALDRKAMIDKLHFGDAELAGPVPPAWDTALPAEQVAAAYQRDVAKAKQLLSAAGAEGLRFELSIGNYGEMPDQAAIIKANLAEAGITVDIAPAELGSWLDNMLLGNFEATVFTHLDFLSDEIPLQSHHTYGSSRAQRDYLGVDDPEVDAILDRIQETLDPEERKKLAWEVQPLILKRHGPTLVLYQPYGYLAAYDYIKGYQPSAFGFGLFKYDYWIDKG
jgi:peptide/nickel transport system substrate-binding protein